MKKIICLSVILFLLFIGNVKAEAFTEGSFINGEYISKVKSGRTYYLTAQFINDESGNAVYCLEPFVEFQNGQNYVKYDSNFEEQLNLSKEQVRRIKLIGYYGYMYKGRTDKKWYVITQYLMWKTIDPNANIYFTDRLNGNKINKYEEEINEIERDVANVEKNYSFGNSLEVYSGTLLEVVDYNYALSNYVVESSSFDTSINDYTLRIDKAFEDGVITLKQNFSERNNAPEIFIHTSSQKLYRVGKPEELRKEINVRSISGSVDLNIKDDDSVYSVESEFKNVCYGIYDENDTLLEKVCTDQEIKYRKDKLKMGNYYVKQISTGVGYVLDSNKYTFSILPDNLNKTIELKNKLIRNDIVINKSYCKGSNCLVEPDAVFSVYDKDNKKVDELITDETGIADIWLGYGSYTIEQTRGKEGYSIADIIETRIENETDKLLYNINNNFKEVTRVASVSKKLEEELPPETRVDNIVSWFKNIIDYIRRFIEKIMNFS